MAKELPYFKFYCSEWISGDITLEDMAEQGLFINICVWYWARECKASIDQCHKRFKQNLCELENLIDSKLIKIKNDFIVINFLDEQMKERKKIAKRNKANGLKGGRPKTQSVSSGLAKKNPNITNKEEKRREEKKEKKVNQKKFTPPSLEDVKKYFDEKGYTEYSADKAFNYYSTADWKDSKGNQVRNWKQKMISVWFKPENEVKKAGGYTL